MQKIPGWKDRILFTPGPLTTSKAVKQAMLRDVGSRDFEFMDLTQNVRKKLLQVAGLSEKHFTAVLLQGSGTYAVEAVFSSVTPKNGKWLIVNNGAYGNRMIQIADVLGISRVAMNYGEDQMPSVKEIEKTLASDSAITHIAMVHCETTSGIFNPIEEVGELAKKFHKTYFVDAMSSFGAVPIDMPALNIDYLASSANKCIEGVPGIGLVIAKTAALEKTEGFARSLSLNLYAQWKDLETKSEFRFTPPIQVMLALDQALDELAAEGGVKARNTRYRENYKTLITGMRKMGFKEYLSPELQGYIITSFHYLEHPKFSYKDFYGRLHEKDIVIYSGKVSNAECFRIGNIGRIFKSDIEALLGAMATALKDMGVNT